MDPFANWVVIRGLQEQKAKGVAHWMKNKTIDLICGASQSSGQSTWADCSVTFPLSFDHTSGSPLPGTCGNASALTAATFVNLLYTDNVRQFKSEPPLNTTWVLAIITFELVVACGIGISCLVFSVNMFRKLRKDEALELEGDDDVFENLRDDQLEQLGLIGNEDQPKSLRQSRKESVLIDRVEEQRKMSFFRGVIMSYFDV